MLLTLMYHQIVNPDKSIGLNEFRNHLKYLQDNFPIVLPGETLKTNKLSICLTFDDAYFDFYHYIYPLLKSYNLRAILGIPTAFIKDDTNESTNNRLNIPYPNGLEKKILEKHTPLCTWKEIKEMVASRHVIPASHSHTHANLTSTSTDLHQELLTSKNIIRDQLGCDVKSFIYPFGSMNSKVQNFVHKHFPYEFRIGSAINYTSNGNKGLLYRIDADHLWCNQQEISPKFIAKSKRKYWLNRLRFK